MTAMLIDTDVLVYAYDRAEPEKQRRALQVLDGLACSGDGRLSAQARERVQHYVQIWPVIPVTSQVVFEAVRGVREHQFSFWHAQIWAAARLNHVSTVLSEDLNPGAVVEGVCFVDPLADDFRLADWELGT